MAVRRLLFVGLGNPGPEYEFNRHNIGFLAVDEILRRRTGPSWRPAYHGLAAEVDLGVARAILLKPSTYMNESGRAVQEAMRFFKLTLSDLAVFHDEIELPPAKVKVKRGGGMAGHNGLRSISACVGNEYWRVRLGVGHPGIKHLVHRHVLSDFSKSDLTWVRGLVDTVAENIELLATEMESTQDASRFQNKVHLGMEQKGFDLDSLAQRGQPPK
ncbi:aminoacyl-tRNA hydrolase [Bradyrhizobium stylosanthis]|uniref:Peptidyl-tRNA hydrolase n=1 Tax=Bradyrhizobium stylosanthis TaxID=1803665 RepID=A0A560D2V6_9BRAD|nr:aminoacyl-tRNA hydrolase [Bradyrhizobium stylosanthis]TWA91411.1 peptidyl-tRNA hydrolase [Bradyrhizobium stylosanthis]